MRGLLVATALTLATCGQAVAADLSSSPAEPSAEAYGWSGIYLGVNGGYSFGGSSWSDSVTGGSTGTFSTSGFLFGGTVGANYQVGSYVLGIEADADWTDPSGAATFTKTSFCAGGCNTASDWLATVRGRVGYAFERVLVYGTAGTAFGNVQASYSNDPVTTTTGIGWTAGVGVEVAVVTNWTAKLEYLFVDLPNGSCTTNCAIQNPMGPPVIPNIAIKFNESIFRLGINYKFDQ